MSDSSRPHGLQPTRLLRPWDFPGESTGVGCHCLLRASSYQLLTQLGNNLPAMQETPVGPLAWEDPLEKGQATYSLVVPLVKRRLQYGRPGLVPWVGKIPWRREQLPTPVFWPGEVHGLYSLCRCRVRHN